VTAEDIRTLAYPVLRHRIFTNFNADAEGIDVDRIIEKILETIPEPTYGEAIPVRGRAAKAAAPAGEVPVVGPAEVPANPLAGQVATPPPGPRTTGPPRVAPTPPPARARGEG